MPHWLFASLRGYRMGWLPGDLVAGLMLAAIAIPGQLATARLAGMPPETGLYAFAAGSLAFAAFGANRFMSVQADSTIARESFAVYHRDPRVLLRDILRATADLDQRTSVGESTHEDR